MMVRASLGAAAVAALMAGPAMAADLYYSPPPAQSPIYGPASMVTGHLEIGGGIVSGDGNTWGAIGGAGRASLALTPTFSFEPEILGGAVFDDGYSYASFAAIGHLYHANPQYAAGVFLGYVSLAGASGVAAGVEANYYFGPTTLFGQLAYISSDYSDVFVARGGGSYYFNPDTKATIDLAYYDSDYGDTWSVTGSAEHRFTGTPWSGFGSLSYASSDSDDAWTAMIGARLFLDQPGSTLQSHDQAVPFNVKLPFFLAEAR
jgi:hypothetical protein